MFHLSTRNSCSDKPSQLSHAKKWSRSPDRLSSLAVNKPIRLIQVKIALRPLLLPSSQPRLVVVTVSPDGHAYRYEKLGAKSANLRLNSRFMGSRLPVSS